MWASSSHTRVSLELFFSTSARSFPSEMYLGNRVFMCLGKIWIFYFSRHFSFFDRLIQNYSQCHTLLRTLLIIFLGKVIVTWIMYICNKLSHYKAQNGLSIDLILKLFHPKDHISEFFFISNSSQPLSSLEEVIVKIVSSVAGRSYCPILKRFI